MSKKQRLTFFKLYIKYKGPQMKMDDTEALKMMEELKQADRALYDLMWPAVLETNKKLVRMNEEALKFFTLVSFWGFFGWKVLILVDFGEIFEGWRLLILVDQKNLIRFRRLEIVVFVGFWKV